MLSSLAPSWEELLTVGLPPPVLFQLHCHQSGQQVPTRPVSVLAPPPSPLRPVLLVTTVRSAVPQTPVPSLPC